MRNSSYSLATQDEGLAFTRSGRRLSLLAWLLLPCRRRRCSCSGSTSLGRARLPPSCTLREISFQRLLRYPPLQNTIPSRALPSSLSVFTQTQINTSKLETKYEIFSLEIVVTGETYRPTRVTQDRFIGWAFPPHHRLDRSAVAARPFI